MELLLTIFASIFGLASSILSLISFYKDKLRHRTFILVLTLIFSCIVIVLSFYLTEERKNRAVQEAEFKGRVQDAKTVADAIIISGWEYPGDYIGYLSQIAGFYKRHAEQYAQEVVTYERQLNEWQEFLKHARQEKRDLYSSDTNNLNGLVRAGRDHLRKISTERID